MGKVYRIDIIPLILDRFNVKSIIVIGSFNKIVSSKILNYSEDSKFSCKYFDSDNGIGKNNVGNHSLNILHELVDYDAIFLNDDSDDYDIFSELNIIKENNEYFPLVFLCNNIFSYDGNVINSIEVFLKENNTISLMDLEILEGIKILYNNSKVNQIILEKIFEELSGYLLDRTGLKEFQEGYHININPTNGAGFNKEFIEQLKNKEELTDYLSDNLKIKEKELRYLKKQSDYNVSQLSLKNSELKFLESKLVNKENEIHNLNYQLDFVNKKINKLKNDFKNEESKYIGQLTYNIYLLNERDAMIFDLDNKIKDISHKLKDLGQQLNDKEKELENVNNKYYGALSNFESNKYYLSSIKDKSKEYHLEIQYLKKNPILKKVLFPFSILYLIIKSQHKEITINLKLFKYLTGSNCFNIGYYLNNNPDVLNSKWFNYFPIELHYICYGFNEHRRFNRKYLDLNSKNELLNYLLKHC